MWWEKNLLLQTVANRGVIQGFPALRKAVITYVKKYDNFSPVFDIAIQKGKPKLRTTLKMAYLAGQNGNRQGEDLPQTDSGALPGHHLPVRKKVKN